MSLWIPSQPRLQDWAACKELPSEAEKAEGFAEERRMCLDWHMTLAVTCQGEGLSEEDFPSQPLNLVAVGDSDDY